MTHGNVAWILAISAFVAILVGILFGFLGANGVLVATVAFLLLAAYLIRDSYRNTREVKKPDINLEAIRLAGHFYYQRG